MAEVTTTLWRCPSHGLIQPEVIDESWPDDPGRQRPEILNWCPVPTYREEPCEEPLSGPFHFKEEQVFTEADQFAALNESSPPRIPSLRRTGSKANRKESP